MSLAIHSAPGANAGFSYQFDRAMDWLSSSPSGAMIGIETDDDVAAKMPDGTVTLEQDKHSIRPDGRPFGDRSKDLWNTLATWLEALHTKEVDASLTSFLMVTNKQLPECIATRISEAGDKEAAMVCISELETAGADPPETIQSLVEKVLHRDKRQSLEFLIIKTSVCDNTFGSGLRNKIRGQLQLPQWCVEMGDSIVEEMHGWLHSTAQEFWYSQKPSWISRDNFITRLHAALDLRKRFIARERSENFLPISAESVGASRGRPFVKQMHLITDDDSVADAAIEDFLRCKSEKIRLSEEGNVTDQDWLSFETTLQSRWNRIQARVKRMSAMNSEADIGFEIFTSTTEDHKEKLAGMDTEQIYLTSGSYHQLADTLQLGWHPRYSEILNGTGNV